MAAADDEGEAAPFPHTHDVGGPAGHARHPQAPQPPADEQGQPTDAIGTEREIDPATIATIVDRLEVPEYKVVEKIINDPWLFKPDVVVEVPEKHHHTILTKVEKVEFKDVPKEVEVPEVHWEPAIEFIEGEKVLGTGKTITVKELTVKEKVRPKPKPIYKDAEHLGRDVAMPLPVSERIIYRPVVKCEPNVIAVPVPEPQEPVVDEEIVYTKVVDREKPKYVAAKEPKVKTYPFQVTVKRDPKEKIEERDYEVDEVHHQKVIHYLPKFQERGVNLNPEDERHQLQQEKVRNAQLEQEKRELQAVLEQQVLEVRRLHAELIREKNTKEVWAEKYRLMSEECAATRRSMATTPATATTHCPESPPTAGPGIPDSPVTPVQLQDQFERAAGQGSTTGDVPPGDVPQTPARRTNLAVGMGSPLSMQIDIGPSLFSPPGRAAAQPNLSVRIDVGAGPPSASASRSQLSRAMARADAAVGMVARVIYNGLDEIPGQAPTEPHAP